MNRYFSLDIESGGIGIEKSLLTVGGVICDEHFNILDKIHIKTKPPDNIFKVTGEALSINHIDLITHSKEALTYKEASGVLYEFLNKWSNGGKDKLLILGKQIAGDIRFIQEYLISKNTWDNFCSYRLIDVSSIFMYLRARGKYPLEMHGGLKDLCDYYHIDITGQHDALFDAIATLEVFKRMLGEVL